MPEPRPGPADATGTTPPPGSPATRRHRRPGLYRDLTRLRDWLVDRLLLAPGFAAYGRHTHLALPLRLAGEHRIAVGDGVYVGAGSWLQTIGDGATVALTIDDDVHIAGACVISAVDHVHVGAGALLARGVYIADHGHAFERDDLPVHAQGVTPPRPTTVGPGAWLGQNVVVLPGVRIGAGAVVGANSVVRDDIPGHCVAVGAPARVLRRIADPHADPRHPPGAEHP